MWSAKGKFDELHTCKKETINASVASFNTSVLPVTN